MTAHIIISLLGVLTLVVYAIATKKRMEASCVWVIRALYQEYAHFDIRVKFIFVLKPISFFKGFYSKRINQANEYNVKEIELCRLL